jgi:hypothetical protein
MDIGIIVKEKTFFLIAIFKSLEMGVSALSSNTIVTVTKSNFSVNDCNLKIFMQSLTNAVVNAKNCYPATLKTAIS